MGNKVQIGVKATADFKDVFDAQKKVQTGIADLKKQNASMQGKAKILAPGQAEELKKATDELIKLHAASKKLMQDLPARNRTLLNQSGQGNKMFWDVDWSKVFPSHRKAAEWLLPRMRAGTAGTRFEGQLPRYDRPPPNERPRWPEAVSNSFYGAGSAIMRSGLKAAGPVGEAALGAGAAARGAGGLATGAGLAAAAPMFVGLLAAAGVGKLISGVMGKLDDAGSNLTALDTLKRQLGDVGADFDELRGRLATTAKSLDMTNKEALQLASTFVKSSGTTSTGVHALDAELKAVGGFARAFGLDPNQSAGFFGAAKRYGVANNDSEMKRLGLAIGDAVAQSRGFAMTDQLLASLQGFIESQTRRSLSPPDVNGFLGTVAALGSRGISGLDMQAAANMVGQVNSAVSAGGFSGDASKNFSMMALSRGGVLDALETAVLQAGGAFGRPDQAFGSDSIHARYMSRFGGRQAPNIGYDSNYGTIMQGLRRYYASNPAGLAFATKNYFGFDSIQQAEALHLFGDQQLNRLGGMGIDVSKVNASAIAEMAAASASPEGAHKQARALLRFGKLSADEAASLKTGDVQKLTDSVVKLTAKYGQVETEGSKTREAISAMDRGLENIASKGLDVLNMIRDGVAKLAGFSSPEDMKKWGDKWGGGSDDARLMATARQMAIKSMEKDYGYIWGHIGKNDEYDIRAKSYYDMLKRQAANANAAPGAADDNSPAYSPIPMPGTNYPDSQIDDDVEAAAKKYGIPLNIARALIQQESSMGKNAKAHYENGDLIYGPAQLNARFHPYDQFKDDASNIDEGMRTLAENYAKHKNGSQYDRWSAALYDYYGHDSFGKNVYAPQVMAKAGLTPTPAGVPAPAGQDSTIRGEATVYVVTKDANGRVTGPATPVTVVMKPNGAAR
jgi:hypothetical protein